MRLDGRKERKVSRTELRKLGEIAFWTLHIKRKDTNAKANISNSHYEVKTEIMVQTLYQYPFAIRIQTNNGVTDSF